MIALMMDSLPTHTAPNVLRACRDVGITPLIVPPGCTFFLQPLDTHVFAGVKRALRQYYDDVRVRTPRGHVDVFGFVECLRSMTEQVFSQSWAKAFEQNGFGEFRGALTKALEELGCASIDVSGNPSLADVALCVPVRRLSAASSIFKFFNEVAGSATMPQKRGPAIAKALSAVAAKRLCGRTRSETRALQGCALSRFCLKACFHMRFLGLLRLDSENLWECRICRIGGSAAIRSAAAGRCARNNNFAVQLYNRCARIDVSSGL